MLILLTNDDGIHAEGILAAEKELKKIGDVVLVAPDREQSASSHSLTLERPLRLFERGENQFTCDGTPTDCVMMGVYGVLKRTYPDLIVSGINHGANMGEDVTYSGTVAAAIEGSNMGIPSIALSNTDKENLSSFQPAAEFSARLVTNINQFHLPRRTFLSVNFPKINGANFEKYKFTRLGRRVYKDILIEKTDPRGKNYYWIAGEAEWQTVDGSDFQAVSEGFVSISPLRMNFTDFETIENMQKLNLKL
jgi:5'-nucleotidase